MPPDASPASGDEAFVRLYGPWEPLDVDQIRALLAGWGAPWWIAGGLAIEAFTGVSRAHEDIDVGFFRRDLPLLRRHLEGRYHLWSAGSGMLRPVTDEHPDLHPESAQVWLRAHALAPWVADLLASPGEEAAYRVHFYPDFHTPLADATWVDADEVRWLNPEIVLGFKCRHRRPKDEADFAAALPLLGDRARLRLRLLVRHVDPAHAWLARL
jgi:hypothetical protein